MAQIASFQFADPTGDEAWIGIGATPGIVTLTVSLRHNGDLTVSLPVEVCDQLCRGLQEAKLYAQGLHDAPTGGVSPGEEGSRLGD